MSLSVREVQAVLRQDLCTFLERSFYDLNPTTRFLHNWHLEVLAAELEACRLGKTKRLIINLPPRSLKSHCASIAFPAWLLGHDPSAQIICASYAQELANKLSSDCRSVVASPWYQDLFPTRLSPQRQALQEFMTVQMGFRMATSVGGGLIGRGADFIIIDDPLKPDEALSETQRKAVNAWYDHTLYTRLNDKQNGCIILIMQRLHEDDLVGHVQELGPWKMVRFPAVAERDEEYVVQTSYGERRFHRRAGEPLHGERESLETLGQLRETVGEYNFAGQYQQAPAPLGGGLVKMEWFRTCAPADWPPKFETTVQSWDTANKPTELADHSVCTTWGVKDKRFYLLNVLRKRLGYPELKRAVLEQAQMFGPATILIEDKASGTQLIQELISDGLHSIKRYEPKMDKVMRMHSVTSTVENGFVFIPEKQPWLAEYLHELTTFPKSKYDDQADSTSQALEWLKQQYMTQRYGVVEFWKQEAARMQQQQSGSGQKPSCCPKCGATCIARIPSEWRCNICGHQFGGTTIVQRGPSRRDVLDRMDRHR